MKKNWHSLILIPVCLGLAACQTVPYDSKKKVETVGNFYTRQLRQEGKNVGRLDVLNSMSKDPGLQVAADQARNWTYAAYALTAVGAYFFAYDLWQNNMSGVYLGALLVGGGAGAAYYSDQSLMDAVLVHNLGKKKRHGALDFDVNLRMAQTGGGVKIPNSIPMLTLQSTF